MTFHLMLGNWIDEDFGYVISETFRVVPGGVEVLTKRPARCSKSDRRVRADYYRRTVSRRP